MEKIVKTKRKPGEKIDTWAQWQRKNWLWWLAAVAGLCWLIYNIATFAPKDWAWYLSTAGSLGMLYLSAYRGIIHDWKEYKNDEVS